MGKEDKEDSGFGFKDKAKAEETLRLLEQHEPNYRRLTVRGLLGRAKRVLSMTKAEEKIKNIKEAIEVFEEWLADLDKGKEKKSDSKEKSSPKKNKDKEDEDGDVEMEDKGKKDLPSDTVPGLGFKDAQAAEGTLQQLEGRDPEYQKLAVKGLIGRAKRVLTCTKDETKVSNIKEAISIFDQFLDDYDTQHLAKQNNPYVSLGIVRTAAKLAGEDISEEQRSFISAYASVAGEYKRLRTVASGEDEPTWDIVRNYALKELKEKHAEAKLFNDKKEPTKEHIEMLMWAYSPEPSQAKKLIAETKDEEPKKDDSKPKKEEESKSKKDDSKDKMDDSEEKKDDKDAKREDRKRKSSPDSSESPAKKQKE